MLETLTLGSLSQPASPPEIPKSTPNPTRDPRSQKLGAKRCRRPQIFYIGDELWPIPRRILSITPFAAVRSITGGASYLLLSLIMYYWWWWWFDVLGIWWKIPSILYLWVHEMWANHCPSCYHISLYIIYLSNPIQLSDRASIKRPENRVHCRDIFFWIVWCQGMHIAVQAVLALAASWTSESWKNIDWNCYWFRWRCTRHPRGTPSLYFILLIFILS
jgi:hypothetical protein